MINRVNSKKIHLEGHADKGRNNVPKGFTLVELLGVIAILTVILLIAIPVYNGVRERINESMYQTKISEVISKSEKYAEENGSMVFDIKTLIEEGILSSDNELLEYKDPRNNRNMVCDILNITFDNGTYTATLKESDKCYTKEELENLYGMVNIKILDENYQEIPNPNGWLQKQKVYATYELRNEYESLKENIESITWLGEGIDSCEKDHLDECLYSREITAVNIKNTMITLIMKINIDGIEFESKTSATILLDVEKPQVKENSIKVDNSVVTSTNKRVTFEITDSGGSGIKEYALVSEKTCNGEEYNNKKKQATDGIQIEYLEEGNYYICVSDVVGNKTEDTDLNDSKNEIKVEKIDTSSPTITDMETTTKEESNTGLDITLKTTVKQLGGTDDLQMCISYTGFLQDCSWEKYYEFKDLTLPEPTTNTTQDIYVTVQNQVGKTSSEKTEHLLATKINYYITSSLNYSERKVIGTSALNPKTFTPELEGYTFVGWRSDKTATSSVLTEKTVGLQEINLYAVFKKGINVYYYNGNTTRNEKTEYSYYNNGNVLDAKFTIAQAGKNGWSNRGWSTSNEAKDEVAYSSLNNTVIKNDITLYGLYSQNIKLSYDKTHDYAMGSTGEQTGTRYYNSSGALKNATFQINTNKFNLRYGTFNNWRIGNPNGKAHNAGEYITLSSNTIMYAKWNLYGDNVIYENGSFNHQSYKVGLEQNPDGSGDCSQININSNSIYFNPKCNKTLIFTEAFLHQQQYLKVTARAIKDNSYGSYYAADFGVARNTLVTDNRYRTVATPLRGKSIIGGSSLNDITSNQTFTLDLGGLTNDTFYAYLHNCDTQYTVTKVWLTNTP